MERPLPSLTAINEGVMLDAAGKFAMQLLLAPNFVNDCRLDEIEPVAYAIELALRFFGRAADAKLLEPLSEDNQITPAERAHVERNAQAQVIAQLHGQKVVQAEQSRVMPVVGRVLNG